MTTGLEGPVLARLLGAAAIAGQRFRLVVVARVLDLEPADCLAAVDRAVRAGVLVTAPDDGEGWFAEEAARLAWAGQLPLAARAELHRRTVDALEREPDPPPGAIARHLAAAVAATVDPVDRLLLQMRLAVRAARDGDLGTAPDPRSAGPS